MNIGVTASNMPNRYNHYDPDPTQKPTGPVGALAYWTADAIKTRYRQRPGLLA